MSPEQARGKAVDRRADIWAFGVVLYEMLTGLRAFKGDEVTDILASVLKDTPALRRAARLHTAAAALDPRALPRARSQGATARHRRGPRATGGDRPRRR